MNIPDFFAKIAWEGGVQGAIEYGLVAEDLEDERLALLWQQMVDQHEGRAHFGLRLDEMYDAFRAEARRISEEIE